ncbi:hypothetical protein [Pelosinus baikalensis]|uniref:Uncharacterized protein n=1 Tax=Pelosinus baikalensis TaxID=2892015 RepID=A0ABS8HXG8_9FIRM|nr:hypothetical protein [Pelosinus baikalensis]MCC5467853.1 hypothetical protein [Pelosinus baikalensis]
MMETTECQMLFFELSPDELTILAALVALGFSKSLDGNQTNVLGNFLAAVGTLMTMIVAQEQALVVQKEETQSDVQKQIKELQGQMQKILNNN